MAAEKTTYGKLIGTECGRGRAALFLHGGLLNRDIFLDLITELKPDRRCVAIDLPGFGDSPPLDGLNLSLPRLADAVGLAIRDISPIDPIDIIGFSLGGGIAVELAHSIPESIHTLCLVGVGGRSGGTSKVLANRSSDAMTASDLEEFAEKFASHMLGSHASQELHQSVCMAVKSTPLETISALTALLEHYPDVIGRAKSLKVPIMALCGADDAMVSYDHLKRAFEGTQGVTIKSVEFAGHLVPLEAPAKLAEVLRAFWNSTAD